MSLKLTMVSLFAGIGLVWVLWLGYALVAPEPEDELPQELVGNSLDSVSGIIDLLARHMGVPVSTGNRIEPLINGKEIFPAMLNAIEQAEHSIRFLTYVYWTGDIAEEFADALAAAAERGVTVRVIIDAYGGLRMDEALVDRMQASGVEVAWYHPFKWYNLRRLNNRTHRKVLVVDGGSGFVGGVGIAKEWTGDARDEDEWRDNHFAVSGSGVAYLDGAFAENWLNATGEMLISPEETTQALPNQSSVMETTRLLILPTSPSGNTSPIALTYWAALKSARRQVDISTPYFLPDPSLIETLEQVVKAGLVVRLLVPGELNDSPLLRMASLTTYERLLKAGVRIYEFQPSMMHTKLLLLDDSISIIGSANFDNRSFELNDEITLVADDKELVSRLRSSFDADLERSTEITLDSQVLPRGIDWLKAHSALMLREQL